MPARPRPEEDWNQRHPRELLDFVTAIAEGRPPVSGFMLARDVTLVLQAAKVSAEEGRGVGLAASPA